MEPLAGRRVIINGRLKEISNTELEAKLEQFGRVERITAGFIADIAFALFEQKSAAQAACTASKGGLNVLSFSLSVAKTNEHVYRQSCKIYNVCPTFPLSPAEGILRTGQGLEQSHAVRPLKDDDSNAVADVPDSALEHSEAPNNRVINFNIGGGDEEKTPDKVWSCNWAEHQSKKVPEVSATRRRRSRKKGKQKAGKDAGNKEDGERRWRSSSKPKTPLAVGRLPCHEGLVRTAHEALDARHGHGAKCYDLSTPQLKPFFPPSSVVEDLDDLDAKSASSYFWD